MNGFLSKRGGWLTLGLALAGVAGYAWVQIDQHGWGPTWQALTGWGQGALESAKQATGQEPTSKVYKTRDAQGRIVYTDQAPNAQSQAANLPKINVVEAPKRAQEAASANAINPVQALREDNARFAKEAQAAKDRRMDRLIETGSTEPSKP